MKMLARTAAAAMVGLCTLAGAAHAATLNVLVMQEDWDTESLARNNRIQNAVLSTINQTLNSPNYQSQLQKYGIQGLDVYDETALTLNFYQQDRQRRTDEELISVVRSVDNPQMDYVIPYTIYARAVTDPYSGIVKLQMSLNYRAIDVRNGRFAGGDNLDLDTQGTAFAGCAAGLNGTPADPHCIKEFVSLNGEKLARNAGNKLAIQLAALLGRQSGGGYATDGGRDGGLNDAIDGDVAALPRRGVGGSGCDNPPTVFAVTFRGFEQRQMNAVEEYMSYWKCALDLDVSKSDFSEITFSYKTRSDQQRVLRNVRLMLELMGVVADPQTEGSNSIVVEALGIREN